MADASQQQAAQARPALHVGLFTAWAASAGLLLVLVVLIAGWSLQQIEGRARARARDDATRRIESIRNRILEEAGARPDATLEDLIRSARWISVVLTRQASTGAHIEWIAIISPAGAVLAHSSGDTLREPSSSSPDTSLLPSEATIPSGSTSTHNSAIQYSVPVVFNQKQLGSVRVSVSAASLDGAVAELLRPVKHAFILLGGVSVLVLLLGGAVMRQVVRRERMLDHAAAQQEHAAAMGALARRMVHEIRNPLNAMRMQIAVVQDMLSDPTISADCVRTEHLGRLDQEVIRVERMAKSFLAYGRPPSDEPELIGLAELIRDVADFIRPSFEKIGAFVKCELQHGAEQVNVRTDKSKLREVLLNLTENAREAMDGGHLTIRLAKKSGREISIQVADTGRGIPETELPRIFEGLRSTKTDGSGLGLLIVKRIIEDAGGSIRVESQVNEGTCFEVTLPIAGEGADGPGTNNGGHIRRTHA
ncbi:MAG TPA: HAMP domain-containing sensor histidine kinase [Phycisphaerae bacterium]|nr:HAMP domain-containing sensor histidine kinase [Phycisphaerae bacterium]HRY71347.1 HAMP domain-containing sensor histidine kinase [Phycisphaerae bacterium]HSA29801.1 HAMP domain-containing sensor histidine kinase [Phycisphaerae bacterium]